MAGSPTLHGYHCDCETCELGGYLFRGQTDSSCSGEIISDVIGTNADLRWRFPERVTLLELAAVEVDAEPGTTAGFHVHVGMDDYNNLHRENALWEFLRWEPTLNRLAGGRWTERRVGMNRNVRDDLGYDLADRYGLNLDSDGFDDFAADGETLSDAKRDAHRWHSNNDRHSNLNIVTHHGTWEFRLWNSTRAAWRMEMFCGLSVALVDPDVVSKLAAVEIPHDFQTTGSTAGFADIQLAVDEAGYGRIAELLDRQTRYVNKRAANAPAMFTIL